MPSSPNPGRGNEDALQAAGETLARRYLWEEGYRRVNWASYARRTGAAVLGVFTFVLGIELMQTSAQDLVPSLIVVLQPLIHDPANSMGFGWLMTYLVLSGSPVAAVALGLFDAGVADPLSAYFMVMGSRFGASFIVIVIGLVAILRGGGREESLSMGVLAFLVTYSIYVPATLLGFFLLADGSLAWLVLPTPLTVAEGVDLLYGPLSDGAVRLLTPAGTFLLAFGALYAGLSVFDRAFHRREVEEVEISSLHRLLEIPTFSFILGAGITLLSTSVTLSLGMLVPLYLKGYLRRRDVVPYIMGANITTFVDTLLVAFLLANPAATNLILVAMLSVFAVSVLALLLYRPYSRGLLWLFHWTFHHRRALVAFAVLLVAVPVVLVFI